jgi:hypothetical protein
VYGTVRTVVWEDGGGNPASYPIFFLTLTLKLRKKYPPYLDFGALGKGPVTISKAISAKGDNL